MTTDQAILLRLAVNNAQRALADLAEVLRRITEDGK